MEGVSRTVGERERSDDFDDFGSSDGRDEYFRRTVTKILSVSGRFVSDSQGGCLSNFVSVNSEDRTILMILDPQTVVIDE